MRIALSQKNQSKMCVETIHLPHIQNKIMRMFHNSILNLHFNNVNQLAEYSILHCHIFWELSLYCPFLLNVWDLCIYPNCNVYTHNLNLNMLMPWSHLCVKPPRIAILGIWGDTWLTCGKYGIYVAVCGSYGALTGSSWHLLESGFSPIYCRVSYMVVTRIPSLVLRNTWNYVMIRRRKFRFPKFVLRCSYEAALRKGVTTALVLMQIYPNSAYIIFMTSECYCISGQWCECTHNLYFVIHVDLCYHQQVNFLCVEMHVTWSPLVWMHP